MVPPSTDYTPILWINLFIFLYRTVTTQAAALEDLERRKIASEARMRRLAGGQEDGEDDGEVDGDGDGETDESEEGEGRGERARVRAAEPEDGIPLDILETLAKSPTYDIREAATKILAARYTSSLPQLNALCDTLWHADPTTPTHHEATAVLDLLRRYQLVEERAGLQARGFEFGERGGRIFVSDGERSGEGGREMEGLQVAEGSMEELLAVLIEAVGAREGEVEVEVEVEVEGSG